MKLANAIIKMILRSPLHRLCSGRFMLITVTGRRSGRQYTIPVQYVRDGDVITVISRRHRRWWRNLRGGAPVGLRVRGRELRGTGELVTTGEEASAADLQAFYQALAPRRATPERIARSAKDRVVIRIQLLK